MKPAPVVFHTWGTYKLELAGLSPKSLHYIGSNELADIELNFYPRFRPDRVHSGSATDRNLCNRQRRTIRDRAFISSIDGLRWTEIQDDYTLANHRDVTGSSKNPALTLNSTNETDEYFDAISVTEKNRF